MQIIIQKFGGTSVQDATTRQQALQHVQAAVQAGKRVVVVVSAIGRKGAPYATDTLLKLVGGSKSQLSARETDMLLSVGETISATVFTEAARQKGLTATTMTGQDAGIVTTADYQNAKILKIDPTPIKTALKTNQVVVVTGFQGATADGHITTIGRGGSDTSAAALGAYLKAERIDIFTDVNGIMTADPRVVEHAQAIQQIGYDELANLAHNGAKVVHPRAVEIARQAHIPMRVRSTTEAPTELGTLVTDQIPTIQHYRTITGVAHQCALTQFCIAATAASTERVFQLLAKANLSIDFLNVTPAQTVFNLTASAADTAATLLKQNQIQYQATSDCAKVALVGAGMTGTPGIAAKVMTILAQNQIPVLQSNDSYTTIWVLVRSQDLKLALNSLHDAFLSSAVALAATS